MKIKPFLALLVLLPTAACINPLGGGGAVSPNGRVATGNSSGSQTRTGDAAEAGSAQPATPGGPKGNGEGTHGGDAGLEALATGLRLALADSAADFASRGAKENERADICVCHIPSPVCGALQAFNAEQLKDCKATATAISAQVAANLGGANPPTIRFSDELLDTYLGKRTARTRSLPGSPIEYFRLAAVQQGAMLFAAGLGHEAAHQAVMDGLPIDDTAVPASLRQEPGGLEDGAAVASAYGYALAQNSLEKGYMRNRIPASYLETPSLAEKGEIPDANWIISVYSLLLKRAPSVAEVTLFRNVLNANDGTCGTSLSIDGARQKVMTIILNSNEFFETYVKDTYQEILTRQPTDVEVRNFIVSLQSGARAELIPPQLYASPEYYTGKLTNHPGVWLNTIAMAIATRLPTAAEIQNFAPNIPKVAPRINMGVYFTNLPAGRATMARKLFLKFLERAPTAKEVAWLYTMPMLDMINAIATLPEFYAKASL